MLLLKKILFSGTPQHYFSVDVKNSGRFRLSEFSASGQTQQSGDSELIHTAVNYTFNLSAKNVSHIILAHLNLSSDIQVIV
jgi:hypothetical protein